MQRYKKQLFSVFVLSGLVLFQQAQAANEPPSTPDEVILTVSGNLEHGDEVGEAKLDAAWLERLSRQQLTTHTGFTEGLQQFEGYLIRDVLDALGADGERVVAIALNDYRAEIPVSDFHEYSVIIADTMNHQPLTDRDEGPLWIVYPRDAHPELQDTRYDDRWVWQLHRLKVE